ncbi:MAG: right-handed parallel beta-helix repeat-containing protein [Acidobacteriota bacterium]
MGAATVLVTPGGAFALTSAIAIAIEDLTVLSLSQAPVVSVRTALGLTLQRLIVACVGGKDAVGVAIALGGIIAGVTIRDNVIIAPIAVQKLDAAANDDSKTAFLLTAVLHIDDNVMLCERQAVALTGTVLHLMTTRIAGNEIMRCDAGAITTLGLCGPGASMKVCDNSLNVTGPGITAGVDGLWIADNKLIASTQRNVVPAGAGVTLRTGLDPNGTNDCQILANQIRGFAGAGIAIQSPAGELIVKLNIISGCGNGIVSDDEAKAGRASIENNHITEIGGADERTGVVVGIHLQRGDVVTVAGNTIRDIGQDAVRAPLRAGIAAVGVRRLRASGNDVSEVAPAGDYVGLAAGIMLRAPYALAEITNNRVERDTQGATLGTRSQWYALLVDQPLADRVFSRVGNFAAVRIDDARTLVFGGRRPYVATAVTETDAAGVVAARTASVSVLGNVLSASGSTPAVAIESSGDCLFNDNRCELVGRQSPAVKIAASVALVNANRVRGGEASIDLTGSKQTAVLGNVTTGPIVPKLPPDWEQLNLRG